MACIRREEKRDRGRTWGEAAAPVLLDPVQLDSSPSPQLSQDAAPPPPCPAHSQPCQHPSTSYTVPHSHCETFGSPSLQWRWGTAKAKHNVTIFTTVSDNLCWYNGFSGQYGERSRQFNAKAAESCNVLGVSLSLKTVPEDPILHTTLGHDDFNSYSLTL